MSKHSRSKTVWRVILAIVSGLGIVALATVADLDSCGFAGNAAFIRIPHRQSASAGNILSSTNDDS